MWRTCVWSDWAQGLSYYVTRYTIASVHNCGIGDKVWHPVDGIWRLDYVYKKGSQASFRNIDSKMRGSDFWSPIADNGEFYHNVWGHKVLLDDAIMDVINNNPWE